MKKAKTTTANDVDQYLANVPEPARTTLQKVRATILSVLPPEATEAISYGIPAVKCNGTLVSYAAFSDSLQLVPDELRRH